MPPVRVVPGAATEPISNGTSRPRVYRWCCSQAAQLVHGAFADAGCWRHVIPTLQGDGLRVIAVQNSLMSLDDDVATTRRVVEAEPRPVRVQPARGARNHRSRGRIDRSHDRRTCPCGISPPHGTWRSGISGQTHNPLKRRRSRMDDVRATLVLVAEPVCLSRQRRAAIRHVLGPGRHRSL